MINGKEKEKVETTYSAVLRTLVGNQRYDDKRNHGNSSKDTQTDGKHLERLSGDREGRRGGRC